MTAFVNVGAAARLAITLRDGDKGIANIGQTVEQGTCTFADRDYIARQVGLERAGDETLRRARFESAEVNRFEIHAAIVSFRA